MEFTLDRVLALGGIILAIVLVVLDKAGKLKGPMLLVLLGVAALLALPLALGNPWVSGANGGMLKFSRGALMFCIVGCLYALVGIWVSTDNEVLEARSPEESARKINTGNQDTSPPPSNPTPQPPPTTTDKKSNSTQPQSKLAVTPTKVNYGTTGSDTESFTFRMSNESDLDLYAVTFKFRVTSGSLSEDDFLVDLAPGSRKQVGDSGAAAKEYADVQGMAGRDSNNRPLFVMYVKRLPRHDFREITVTSIRAGTATVEALPGFSTTEAQPFSMKDGRVTFHLETDESFVQKRFIYLLAESPKEKGKKLGHPAIEVRTFAIFSGTVLIIDRQCPVVVWSGSIVSRSGAASALIDWKISLELPDGRSVEGIAPPLSAEEVMKVNMRGYQTPGIDIKTKDYFPRKSAITPISPGNVLSGWFWGTFKSLDVGTLPGTATVVVQFSDVVSGKVHTIRQELGSAPTDYPGFAPKEKP